MLNSYGMKYTELPGDLMSADKIIDDVLALLGDKRI